MRNKFILAVLLFLAASGLTWAQFWKSYSDTERRSLAEAYWLAGSQYQAVGLSEKGAAFKAVAKSIDPALDSSSITDRALPSAAELLAQGRTVTIGAGAGSVPTAAINSFFLRFVGAMLDENTAEVLTFLDGSVYLTKEPAEVSSADARTSFDAFFKASPLKGQTASQVYDLNSLVVARVPQAMRSAWGETYTLNVTARADYSAAARFWEQKQQFFIHRTPDGWRILAIGQAAPPLTWSPQKAAPAAAAPQGPETPEADPAAAISDTFKEFMTAILSKDADAALKDVSANVRFLRLRQTVTKDELKTTMLGYFDKADFPSALISDSLDLSSIFVEAADSPIDGVGGPVYRLNVKSTADLSAGIPFWGSYMQFYFSREDGSWAIFAVM